MAFNAAQALSRSMEENTAEILKTVGNSDDIVSRTFKTGPGAQVSIGLLYTDGLTDTNAVQQFVIAPLMSHIASQDSDILNPSNMELLSAIKEQILTAVSVEEITGREAMIDALLSGQVILLAEGCSQALSINMSQWEDRSVSESTSQSVVRGPKEAFKENLRTNTALLRRKIKAPELWLESISLGRYTKTSVAIMYMNGLAKGKVVEEVRLRLGRIKLDGILESSYIEEMIEDSTWTPFPTVYNSERPDVIAAGLLEGRIAILVDGTPFVLMVPGLFVQFYQSAEDHYQRADISTLVRFIRIIALIITLSAPSLNKIDRVSKSMLIGELTGGFQLEIIIVLTIAVLGAPIAANQIYPVYSLAKKLSIGNFLERIEAMLAIMWTGHRLFQ